MFNKSECILRLESQYLALERQKDLNRLSHIECEARLNEEIIYCLKRLIDLNKERLKSLNEGLRQADEEHIK